MSIAADSAVIAPVPARQVPTRRLSFDEVVAGLPKHFAADGEVFLSHMWAYLSALFPEGEDFFVRSVCRHRDRVTDPELRARVTGFIGQEAQHARAHRVFNERLAELGYPTRQIERVSTRMLRFMERVLSPAACLARTAALEHFTATLAGYVLTDPGFRSTMGDPLITELVLWHALEETEHKSVAFDVYRAVGGTERMRVLTMKMIRYLFTVSLLVTTAVSMLGDPAGRNVRELRRAWRSLRSSPFLSRRSWAQLKSYEQPGFHPDDHDTSALVAEWRNLLFGPEGQLRARLVSTRQAS